MKLVNLQNFTPEIGQNLDFCIYLKTSDTKVLLLFNAQTLFNEEDLARYNKYNQPKCLFIKEEDYTKILNKEMANLQESIDSNEGIDAQAGLQAAKKIFSTGELLTSEGKLDSMVNMANQFVVDLLKSSKDQRSQALVELLKDLSDNNDPFVNHANQVAAISTMIALMIEDVTLDYIIEINLVSILHGMGLMLMSNQKNEFFSNYADFNSFKELASKTDQAVTKKVIDKHFDGHNKLTTSDNVIFLQHLNFVELNLDKIKIKNIKPQSLLKTLSDFKTILVSANDVSQQTSNPYISAKILAVGDRLVSLMNFYKKNPEFVSLSIRDIEKINTQAKPIFDKKIIDKVSQMG